MLSATMARGQWVRLLHAAGREAVCACVEALREAEGLAIRPRSVPQAGLGMLALREPSLGEVFNLGEFPLSRAEVEVEVEGVAGAALVMADDAELAAALAVCDAVLAGGLAGHERVEALLAAGREAVARESAVRAGLLASTTVDFALLEEDADADA